MIKFFEPAEEAQIIQAIREAELNTSGEIRVHLEAKCKGDILRAAQKTFRKLKMDKTANRNGVLIFIAPERKEFAILGDKAINEVVPENFWQSERDLMQQHFREQNFAKGISAVVLQIGEKLKTHFPYQQDDINELPDDISYA